MSDRENLPSDTSEDPNEPDTPERTRRDLLDALSAAFRSDAVASAIIEGPRGATSLSVLSGYTRAHQLRDPKDTLWPITIWQTTPLGGPTPQAPTEYDVMLAGDGDRNNLLDNFSTEYVDYPGAEFTPEVMADGEQGWYADEVQLARITDAVWDPPQAQVKLDRDLASQGGDAPNPPTA